MKRMVDNAKTKVLDQIESTSDTLITVGTNLVVDGYINQGSPNYELDLEQAIINGGNYSSYFKSDNWYSAFKEINGVLWFIISGTGIVQTFAGGNAILYITIPDSFKELYYNKIYRADGTSLDEVASSSSLYDCTITGKPVIYNYNNTTFSQFDCFLVSSANANKNIYINIRSYPATTENDTLYIDIRFPIMIL